MDLYSEVVDEPIEHDVEHGEKEENGETNGNKVDILAASSVDDRLLRRAKRPSKYLIKQQKEGSSSPNGPNGLAEGSVGLLNGTRTAKNLRRPRNGYGRGLPKKGINLILSHSSCDNLFILFVALFHRHYVMTWFSVSHLPIGSDHLPIFFLYLPKMVDEFRGKRGLQWRGGVRKASQTYKDRVAICP